jgi:3'(2'), 5'-bisphosphate nucleotidase
VASTHGGTSDRWAVDAALARALAVEAGQVLLAVRSSGPTGADLKDAGDAAAQQVLARGLAEHRSGDVVLSEEAADPVARATADRVWIVDPLDGTREFAEPGRSDWAVHVALWDRAAGGLVAAAVALPALDVCYGTDVPPAQADRPPRSATAPDRRLRLAVSRSRPPGCLVDLAAGLDAELVPLGSAGVKCAAIWRAETDAYVHAGGLYQWDSAAPVAVARAAGLHASRIDGSELEYNGPDPLLPDLVVCRPEVADRVLAALSERRT